MILIFTGLARSGKTFASQYLKSKGFDILTFSDILVEECKKRGIEPTKENLSILGDTLRKELGMGALGRLILKKIRSEKVVLDGARSVEEIDEIRKKFPNAKLIHIDADPEVRYSRRNEKDPRTKKEFFARDERDIKNKGLGKVIEMADIRVDNNGTPEEFKKKLDELVKDLEDEEEYSKYGVKIGIEIHQRLNTTKLFCSCSSEQREQPIDVVERMLYRSVGELGEVDRAATFETEKKMKFIYRVYPNESCLVELDEEPPHEMNIEALKIGIQFCKMTSCKFPDEVHVMRKIVVDGSNTTGFQRTALIGFGGFVPSSLGKVRIASVCIEEEAARIEEKKDDRVIYKLNGLGIPLIEISTSPDIKTPRHAREVAEKIGRLLRALNVQRGIGTIRQDINISVKGGARVEIKGFQELREMEDVIRAEIQRQLALIEIKKSVKPFGPQEIKDVTDVFSKCKTKFLRSIIESGGHVYASKLPGLKGYLKKSLGQHTLGKELAYYAIVYGPKGIIHNDEDLEKYGLSKEFEDLKKILKATDSDIIFIVAGRNARRAAEAVVKRASILGKKIPEETRVAKAGDSVYLRPLPGSHRMYPETDIPPITLDKYLDVEIPKTLDEYEMELSKKIGRELATSIVRSRDFKRFLELSKSVKDVKTLAVLFTNIFKELRREGFDVNLSDEDIITILGHVESGRISKSSLKDVILSFARGERDISKFSLLKGKDLENLVREIIEKNPGKNEKALMGIIMEKYRGRVDGREVFEMIKKLVR